MDITSTIRITLDTGIERLIAGTWPQLKPGDHLALRVIDLRDGQRALVEFGRFRALAEVTFPVAAGDELIVKVLDTQGQLRLGLVQAPSPIEDPPARWTEPLRPFADEALRQARNHLDQMLTWLQRLPDGEGTFAELRNALADLQSFLEPLHPEFGAESTAFRVRSFCEDSGVFFEKHLEAALREGVAEGNPEDPEQVCGSPSINRILAQDLKARLAVIKSLLDQSGSGQPFAGTQEAGSLARSVDALLSDIGHRQAEFVRRREASDLLHVIHFSLPLQGVAADAKLKIGFPRTRGARPQDGFRAALLLEFDRIGEFRVDLYMVDRNLTASLFVKTPDVKATVEDHVHEIRSALRPFFDHVQVNVSVSERKIARFEFEDLQPAEAKQLDVRV